MLDIYGSSFLSHAAKMVKTWIVVLVSLAHVLFQVSSQPGFVSIDCGGNANYTIQETGIRWTIDEGYINTGYVANTSIVNGSRAMQTVRYFPDQRKNCYVLHVEAGNRYLVRTMFAYGNYDGKENPPQIQLIVDATVVGTVNTVELAFYEIIIFEVLETLSICVAGYQRVDIPFISSLELRLLPKNMYTAATMENFLSKAYMINPGDLNNAGTWLPFKIFDSKWDAELTILHRHSRWKELYANSSIHSRPEDPEHVVMKANDVLQMSFLHSELFANNSTYLYLADLGNASAIESFTFDIAINTIVDASSLNVASAVGPYTAYRPLQDMDTLSGVLNITMGRRLLSTYGPILNALELFNLSAVATSTFPQDAHGILLFKKDLNLEQWSGDPCLPYPWEWVTCSSSQPIRIINVNLSSMHLFGTISPFISELTELTDLLLDHNNFTGFIPNLSSLKKLQILHLQNNNLEGPIPQTLASLPNLTELFLNDNELNGTVPAELESNQRIHTSFSGNPLLCLSNRTCFHSFGIPDKGPQKIRLRTLVATLLAVLSASFLVIFLLLLIKKMRASATDKGLTSAHNKLHGTPHILPSRSNKNILKQVRSFDLQEIRVATGNFNMKIGEGGFGAVYYGRLIDGQEIAVKVQLNNSPLGEQQFLNEVEFLSRVHHRNVVSLIGYYHSSKERMLIYEYLPGGNLEDRLFAHESVTPQPLPWKARLQIAMDAAKGLAYLHNDCNPSIIHRDVKCCNILLTDKLVAKLADFGLSKLGPEDGSNYVMTIVRGTSGYLDPEYYETQKLTQKSDVYGFGVVLLEIISGREPLISDAGRTHWKLCDWVRDLLKKDNIADIVDPSLGGVYIEEAMWRVAEVAMSCVEPRSMHRPRMIDVLQELQEAMAIEQRSSINITDFDPSLPIRLYDYSQNSF